MTRTLRDSNAKGMARFQQEHSTRVNGSVC